MTALQLIALSARQKNTAAQHSARRLAGINASHLSDYLVDEVLDYLELAPEKRQQVQRCLINDLNPQAVSGRQEMLEGVVNRFIYR